MKGYRLDLSGSGEAQVVNSVINLLVLKNVENFLTRRRYIRFSRKGLLHGVG